jgi:tetratricopeptide (TPR) repeat protein
MVRALLLPLLVACAAPAPPPDADALARSGAQLYRTGNWRGALRELDAALALDPEHFDALVHRALLYSELGEPERAIADAQRSIVSRPEHPGGFHALGRACLSNGELEAAINGFSRAVELDPRHADAYAGRGWATEKLPPSKSNLRKAAADLSRALRVAPSEWTDRPRAEAAVTRIREALRRLEAEY